MRALKYVNSIDFDEPFTALQTQGMVCHQTFKTKEEQWVFPSDIIKKNSEYLHFKTKEPVVAGRIEKMSKSKKNVVDPQQIIENYGADTARFFMLSDSPPNRDMEWSDSGVEGSWRFLNKLWKFVKILHNSDTKDELPKIISKQNKELLGFMNTTIKDVTKAIDEFHFNIAVAQIRSLFNIVSSHKIENDNDSKVVLFVTRKLLILINPMVPHLAEELWSDLGNKNTISHQRWPKVDLDYIKKENIKIPIQVNGKVRAVIEVPIDLDKSDIEQIALREKNVLKFLNRNPKKVIIIPNRVVNFVI
jgi:leucyl-tRNA synthetase